uniref:(northern house mosquito) hypothetical protein n=1 Tax=Culex pipiens TaxID=7175 RepID=A0A8D8ING4_CULPI
MSEILLGWWVSCVNHRRSRSTVLVTILILVLVILLWLVRVMTLRTRRVSRVLRTGWSHAGSATLLLLHLMRLVHLGKLLLHVEIQALVPGLVLLLVDFDADDPLAVHAGIVLSIFGDGSSCWRNRSNTVRRR